MAADPSYDPTEFQTVFRAWMERNGLSQMAAGQTIGISQGIINRWLKPAGDPYLVQPTIDSLEKIAPYVRVPLIQLKRMTNNLSPADLDILTAVAPGKPDHQLEALFSEMRERWPELPDAKRREVEDVNRVLLGLHHERGRNVRKPHPKRQQDTEGGDTPSTSRLLIAV